MSPELRDVQIPGGAIPRRPATIIQEPVPANVSTLDRFFNRLRAFLPRNLFYTLPKPFDHMTAYTITLPVGDTWVDLQIKLQNRRAWALENTSAVAGNDVWVNSVGMTAVAQGGLAFANGGVFSIPGSSMMNVHAFPVVAGTVISFLQWA